MSEYFILFIIIFTLNIGAYIWAFSNQSDKLTDITYSISFLVVTLILWFRSEMNPAKYTLIAMIIFWAVRLGGFLLYRIIKMGKDERFEDFRNSKSGFLKFWLLQSVSIWILVLPLIPGMSDPLMTKIHIPAVTLFIVGWILEALSDYQKFSYKNRFGRKALMTNGLYTYIRHPNYLGEIFMWVAIFWFVTPVLSGWEWVVIISPVWIMVLLIKISGIPLIEKGNFVKYKNKPEYQEYVKRTYRLIPFLY